MDNQTPIIEINNLSFSYGSDLVLKDINLVVNKGDYLGIIGPNGGGKSTLLKLILGLLTFNRGTIKLFGTEIKDFKDWPKIGYVSQKSSASDQNFPATVKEVVATGRYSKIGLFKLPTKLDNQKVLAALKQVDMLEFKDRLIGQLSGGQQQRVLIARAIASEPELLFLDEPSTGIDIKAQEEFYNLLTKLNHENGITLVLVSHDIDVVAHEVTQIACINQSLIFDGSPKEFIKTDFLESLYGKELRFVLHNHQKN